MAALPIDLDRAARTPLRRRGFPRVPSRHISGFSRYYVPDMKDMPYQITSQTLFDTFV